MPLRDLVLITFFVCSLPFCFIRPFYGILLWTITAFLNPQAFIWSSARDLPWAMAIAIPTLAGGLMFTRGWSALKSREVGLIGVLWGWFCITTVVSISTPMFMHHAQDTTTRWSFVTKILVMVLFSIAVINTFERLRWLLIGIAGSFGVLVAKAFPFIIATGGSYRIYGPDRSMIADNNDFGLAMNMTLPLFFLLAQTEERPWLKKLWSALFVMAIPAVLFTYSRGALIGLLAVFLSLLTFLKFQHRLLLLSVAAAAVIAVFMFAPDTWLHRMDPTREDQIDGSAQGRLAAWKFAMALAEDYPITGGGFETFTTELFDRYAPGARRRVAHSIYFQLIGEQGYVGLMLYLVLVASSFLTARRITREARARGDQQVQLYARMFQISLVGFLSSGLFLSRAYFDYFFTIVACLVILKQVARAEWARQDEEAEESADDQYQLSHLTLEPELP